MQVLFFFPWEHAIFNLVCPLNPRLPLASCPSVQDFGALSLVNKSISEPGVYVGIPVRKLADAVSDEWVSHLQV